VSPRVAIVGCGLIGGSLLRGLHAAGRTNLLAVDRDEATRQAIEGLGIEASASIEAVAGSQLILLALPIPELLASFEPLGRMLAGRAGVVVSDVGGIKEPVLREAGRTLPAGVTFVGAHPMAGKERGGFHQADPALFQGRTVAVCPGSAAAEKPVELVEALWQSVGAHTVRCDAAAHDQAVARISHLPYLVAASLARVAGRGDALARALAAGGLRDTTRVAEDPTIRHAVRINPAVPALARETARELRALADALESGASIDQELDEAARVRRALFP
jgi:prephenate dehydrogenase